MDNLVLMSKYRKDDHWADMERLWQFHQQLNKTWGKNLDALVSQYGFKRRWFEGDASLRDRAGSLVTFPRLRNPLPVVEPMKLSHRIFVAVASFFLWLGTKFRG